MKQKQISCGQSTEIAMSNANLLFLPLKVVIVYDKTPEEFETDSPTVSTCYSTSGILSGWFVVRHEETSYYYWTIWTQDIKPIAIKMIKYEFAINTTTFFSKDIFTKLRCK